MSHFSHQTSTRLGVLTKTAICLSLCVALLAGCSGEPRRRLPRSAEKKASAGTSIDEEFQRGREMLFQLYEFDSEEGSLRCALFFNQWLSQQSQGDWKPDPMVETLP